VEAPFTGDINGAEVTADLAMAVPIGAGGYASFSAGAAWVTGEMMDDLFGVTPAQAAASMFPAYDPDGGLRAYRFGATAFRPVWGNWNGLVSLGYDRLTGDAANSPIVETRDQYRLGAGLLYRFGG
jgi:outer membrane protein